MATLPHCRVHRSTTQTGFLANVAKRVEFDVVDYDPDGMFDGTDTFTLSEDGLWLIEGNAEYSANANLQVDIDSPSLGVQVARERYGNATTEAGNPAVCRRFTAGTTFRLLATGSANGSVLGNGEVTHFSLTKLGD